MIKENGEVTIQNRKGVNYTRRLPEVVDAAKELIAKDFIIDTEMVYINPTGKEEFTASQRRCSTQDWTKIFYLHKQYPITAEAFDIIKLNGVNLEKHPWGVRKTLLEELLTGHEGTFQYVQHRFDLEAYWEEVKQRESEGLILKDVNSAYEHARSYKWLKLKNWRHMVVDVVGFTPGKNSRAHFFGALVLAKDGKHIGCAGSGFNDWELRQIKDLLADAPQRQRLLNGELYTAVDIDMKVKVKYYQITAENNVMRMPIFEKIVK